MAVIPLKVLLEITENYAKEPVPEVVELPIDTPHIGAIIAEMEAGYGLRKLQELARERGDKFRPHSDLLTQAETEAVIRHWQMEREAHLRQGAHSIPDPHGSSGDAWKGWAERLDWGETRLQPEKPGTYESPDNGIGFPKQVDE